MKKLTLILTLLIMVIPSTLEARRKENRKTDIVAHRGFWNCEEAGYAKNSIAALRCAQEAGFWGSEFDVNITADSVLIVYHDGEIDGKKIEDHPYSEFKDFKIANGETIPTIDEFLAQGKKYPATKLVYEFKPQSNPETENTFVNLAIANLAENGLLDPDRVMFISFSRNICELKVNGVDYNHEVFVKNPKWYKMARKNGMSVNAWTVNKEEDMVRMIKLGVDQITTDYPLELRALLK